MYKIALKNILQNRSRSILAIIGLSIAIVGLISLVSISAGITQSVEESFEGMTGIIVQEEDKFEMQSRLDMEKKNEIESVTGVTVASPIVEGLVTKVEGEEPEAQMGPMLGGFLYGIDPSQEMERADGGPYKENLKRGSFLDSRTGHNILISEDIADEYNKRVGSRISVDGEDFTVVGIYETGTEFLDMAYVIPVETARDMMGLDDDEVVYFQVGVEDPARAEEISDRIEFQIDDIEASSMAEFQEDIDEVLGQIRTFFVAISFIAVLVGAIGILNTMLMSVMERMQEFGVLKAMGWTKNNIIKLVSLESLYLGIIGGLLGTVLGIGAAIGLEKTALPFPVVITPELIVIAIVLSIVLGLIGGIYPAWKAAKLDPVEAIRD